METAERSTNKTKNAKGNAKRPSSNRRVAMLASSRNASEKEVLIAHGTTNRILWLVCSFCDNLRFFKSAPQKRGKKWVKKKSTAHSFGLREHILKTTLVVGAHCAIYNASNNKNIAAGIQYGSLTLLASSSRWSCKHNSVLPKGAAQWHAGSKAARLLSRYRSEFHPQQKRRNGGCISYHGLPRSQLKFF